MDHKYCRSSNVRLLSSVALATHFLEAEGCKKVAILDFGRSVCGSNPLYSVASPQVEFRIRSESFW